MSISVISTIFPRFITFPQFWATCFVHTVTAIPVKRVIVISCHVDLHSDRAVHIFIVANPWKNLSVLILINCIPLKVQCRPSKILTHFHEEGWTHHMHVYGSQYFHIEIQWKYSLQVYNIFVVRSNAYAWLSRWK